MYKYRRQIIAIVACVLAIIMILSVVVPAVTSVASALTPSQANLNKLKDEAAQLKAEQDELQAQIDSLEYEKSTAFGKITMLDERYYNTQEAVENIEAQIETYNELIAEKQLELEQASAEEAEQFEKYKERIRAMEENGTVSYIAILFGARDFGDLLGRIDIISEVLDSDKRMSEQLKAAKETTAAKKAEYETTLSELERTKSDLKALQRTLESQRQESVDIFNSVQGDLDTLLAFQEETDAAENALWEEIYAMQEELDRIARESIENTAAVVSTGSFIWPSAVSRKVTSPFGNRLHPIYNYYRMHNGIDIGGADYNTAIYAADGGVVTFAGRNSSYGIYVVINHGNGYTTLYAHMNERYVSTGDTVTQGETIGVVGSTGASTGPHIHFEISKDSTRIDPLQFFSNYIKGW